MNWEFEVTVVDVWGRQRRFENAHALVAPGGHLQVRSRGRLLVNHGPGDWATYFVSIRKEWPGQGLPSREDG